MKRQKLNRQGRADHGRGAHLALVGLEPERLETLAAELPGGHLAIEADVADQEALDGAIAEIVERFGGIDVVVANAGIANNGTVAITPPDVLARVIEVNLLGVVRTIAAALPHVTARRGYVLIVSSAAAFSGLPGLAAYCASKAGVEQFGNILRLGRWARPPRSTPARRRSSTPSIAAAAGSTSPGRPASCTRCARWSTARSATSSSAEFGRQSVGMG